MTIEPLLIGTFFPLHLYFLPPVFPKMTLRYTDWDLAGVKLLLLLLLYWKSEIFLNIKKNKTRYTAILQSTDAFLHQQPWPRMTFKQPSIASNEKGYIFTHELSNTYTHTQTRAKYISVKMAEDVESLRQKKNKKMCESGVSNPVKIPFTEKWTLSPIPVAPQMNEQHFHLTTMLDILQTSERLIVLLKTS